MYDYRRILDPDAYITENCAMGRAPPSSKCALQRSMGHLRRLLMVVKTHSHASRGVYLWIVANESGQSPCKSDVRLHRLRVPVRSAACQRESLSTDTGSCQRHSASIRQQGTTFGYAGSHKSLGAAAFQSRTRRIDDPTALLYPTQ